MFHYFLHSRMLITFKNIKFRNLDTYDKETAVYSQTAVYERGRYDLNEEMYKKITDAPKNLKPKTFMKRIKYDEVPKQNNY